MNTPWPHKVLFIAAPFLPRIGGVQNIVCSLAGVFSARGHEVTVMTAEPATHSDRFPFRVVRQPRVAQVWREFTCADAIIQFGAGIRLGWPLLLKQFPVLTSHQIWQPTGESPLQRKLRRRILNRTLNVCCSRALAERLGVSSAVIGNPFNDKLFRETESPRDHDLVFVGRLVPEKGADLLLEGLAVLKNRALRPSTTIVGDGPQLKDLQRQAAVLGLEHQVQFAGALAGEALVQLLNRHRVLVVPSRWEEPFGVVALEGLACGCSVVASDGGGLPEAIGSCGHFFKSGNADAMANKIVEALEHGHRHDRESSAGHLRHFTAAAITDRYLTILHQHFQPTAG